MRRRSTSSEEFTKIAADVVRTLAPGARACVVTLSGELGAGKTAFVQETARLLGVRETVASPTFVIEKIYELEGQRFRRLVHIDAYRLKSAEELLNLGWEELLADKGTLIFLEWPERVASLIPDDATKVRIDMEGEGRIITVNGGKKSGQKSSFRKNPSETEAPGTS